jgi:hypothetical protein
VPQESERVAGRDVILLRPALQNVGILGQKVPEIGPDGLLGIRDICERQAD